jgi:hypothetical protein
MAYDPHAAYEPPRRAYYGQPPQAPPAQRGYQAQEHYDNYAQGYGQNYNQQNQQYGGGYDQYQQYGEASGYAQDTTQPQEQNYSDGYYGGGSYPKKQPRVSIKEEHVPKELANGCTVSSVL